MEDVISIAELMRISGSDAIIVLAKEIWYYIDNLTNRYLIYTFGGGKQ